ncbi:hypothetical protein SHDE107825_19360 [Shewanella denitrificans]
MTRWITGYPITKDRLLSFKANGHTKTEKVSHGDLRDDRPSHGRDVRALMDDSGLNQKGCVSSRLFMTKMGHGKPVRLSFNPADLCPKECFDKLNWRLRPLH